MRKVAIEFGYSPTLVNAVMSTHKFRDAGELVSFLFDNEDVYESCTDTVEESPREESVVDRSLLKETAFLYSQSKCVSCKQAPRERVLLPCSHFSLCNSCYFIMKHCPVCKEEYSDGIRTFIS